MPCKISKIEYHLPSITINNNEIIKDTDYNIKKFEKNVGILSRKICSENESALSLSIEAVNKLFVKNSINPKSIDLIIFCTQSPDYLIPTNACLIHKEFDFRNDVGVFDYNLGCSGYTYGLMIAKAFINSNQANSVLLVTADHYSKYINSKDITNQLIFGDGASATLIEKSNTEKIFNFKMGTMGEGFDKLIIKNKVYEAYSNSNNDLIEKTYGKINTFTDKNLYMDGPYIFNFTLNNIPDFTRDTLAINNKSISDIDQFIFHQANSFLINSLRLSLGIQESNFYNNITNTGNTVSCTIPIALKDYSKKISKKENILLNGFGVGLSMCAGTIEIENEL